ncbi:hypothetical protein [Flavobacterium algoritolerans]|uniref:Uncharacterized protein n=1 Tax=Flavobacterium algoritolerans TaxID=3041254 RepID=A0ABT6VB36_9FLAO|nr:hypothetical protein [Flavobacterium algoritolerans]MDI5894364.1 hypothetical protein [Flavobacterium algoritolerans]
MKTTITKQSKIETLEQLFNQAPEVDSFMFALWMFWCESVTINSRELQQVLANRSVNNWFLTELRKEEKECAMLLLEYKGVSQDDKNKLYIKCIYKLFSKFPLSLLKNAKHREIKPKTSKVPGYQIEFSIINLN